jgi:hypothetical protein
MWFLLKIYTILNIVLNTKYLESSIDTEVAVFGINIEKEVNNLSKH